MNSEIKNIYYDPYHKDISIQIGNNLKHQASSKINENLSSELVNVLEGDFTSVRFKISNIRILISDHRIDRKKFQSSWEAYEWGISILEKLEGKNALSWYDCLVKAGKNS